MFKHKFSMTGVKNSLTSFDPNTFSVVNLIIRSMGKNLENFKEFLKNLSVNFSTICLSETWCGSKENYRTRIRFYQAIIVFINIGETTEKEVSVSL